MSGLVFIGATRDQRFRAFDAKSDKELWVTRLDAAQPQRPSHIKAKMASESVVMGFRTAVRCGPRHRV